jgi:hypothetical protein
MRKTKFTRLEWYYTGADENLFDLSTDQRTWFRLLVAGAL